MEEYVRPPLDNVMNWNDLPPKLPGRVILKRIPVPTTTAGGLALPKNEKVDVMGMAWIVRAYGGAEEHLQQGDSALLMSCALDQGLLFPSPTVRDEHGDLVEVDADQIRHFYRPENADAAT